MSTTGLPLAFLLPTYPPFIAVVAAAVAVHRLRDETTVRDDRCYWRRYVVVVVAVRTWIYLYLYPVRDAGPLFGDNAGGACVYVFARNWKVRFENERRRSKNANRKLSLFALPTTTETEIRTTVMLRIQIKVMSLRCVRYINIYVYICMSTATDATDFPKSRENE